MKLFASLFNVISAIITWWKRKELVDQGRKEQILDSIAEVETRVKKAETVAAASDSVRDKRLRNRFDRSSGDQ